jgi:hypothetical protein
MENYIALRNRYPNPISLDELSRICKIAKKSARYLVNNGIIPAIDTGKQTWRYQISIEDVIVYLRKRENAGSMIPRGAVSSRRNSRAISKYNGRKSYSQMIMPGEEYELVEYFSFIFADCDEVLTTTAIADMIGLNRRTVLQLAMTGVIKSIESRPMYLIPKQYLLDFVVTRRFLDSKSDSELFNRILGGFEIWKNAKS